MQLDFGFAPAEPPARLPRAGRPATRSGTAQQFEFFGLDRLQQHTVYFAVLPDANIAREVEAARRKIAGRDGLAGKCTEPPRLHISLLCLCRQSPRLLAPEAEEAALAAARFVRLEPFEVVLDRATTFGRAADAAAGKRPVVLGLAETAGMRSLYQRLHGVLERARVIGGRMRPFTPHMTMLYGAAAVDEPVAPIRWTVREFHLVHSLHGRAQHRILGSFPLRG
jgi:2'-5' RNA ligase